MTITHDELARAFWIAFLVNQKERGSVFCIFYPDKFSATVLLIDGSSFHLKDNNLGGLGKKIARAIIAEFPGAAHMAFKGKLNAGGELKKIINKQLRIQCAKNARNKIPASGRTLSNAYLVS